MVGLGANKVNDVLYDKSADSNVWAYSEVKASDLDKELGVSPHHHYRYDLDAALCRTGFLCRDQSSRSDHRLLQSLL